MKDSYCKQDNTYTKVCQGVPIHPPLLERWFPWQEIINDCYNYFKLKWMNFI